VRPTPGHPASGVTCLDAPQAAPVWQDPRAPWYALACRARRDAAGPHGGHRASGLGGGRPLLAWTHDRGHTMEREGDERDPIRTVLD
jgi:hypothetical protein